jgi:hypothetical protein
VVAPIVVTGTGRSGTSILHELLAQDPALRAPLTWECWEPMPRTPGADDADRRIRRTHVDVTRWDRITPSYRTMHENGALIPQECIFLTDHEFASDDLGGRYTIPTYSGWLAGADLRPAYRMHHTILGLLQGDDVDTRWVLKAPSHLSALPALFAVYPDARLVVTHRDPLRVLGSITSLMATLRWINSDRVDHDGLVQLMAVALPYLLDNYAAQVDDGTVPGRQVVDVRYADLLADPMAAVGSVYEAFDLTFTDDARDRMQRYLAARPQGRHGTHRYAFDDLGVDRAALRDQVAAYQARFAVPDEA